MMIEIRKRESEGKESRKWRLERWKRKTLIGSAEKEVRKWRSGR
jgi:hypothetical protein